jgi:hypothetical protein
MKFFRALKKLFYYLTEERNKSFSSTPKNEIEIEQEDIEEYEIENPYVNQAKEWAVNKIQTCHNVENARALAAEFDEWINITSEDEVEYVYLEDEQWTDEQEIDVKE